MSQEESTTTQEGLGSLNDVAQVLDNIENKTEADNVKTTERTNGIVFFYSLLFKFFFLFFFFLFFY